LRRLCLYFLQKRNTMKRLREAERADLLLTVLRATTGSIVGYAAAADLIEWRGRAVGRPMAQVCSRLDLAAFNAGLPMLALNRVRTKDGSINHAAFSGSWEKYRAEIERRMQTYCWRQQDFVSLQAELDRLPNRSAKILWERIETQELSNPGFILGQLSGEYGHTT
jgi:hypothetical protein